ncbi:hypothetical protein [Endozoicomonas acroporae]|uniref:hypothetical protein n=1 Tax=Endozoicomonas acroporae TaxID=1701104 RepID=UPI0015802BCC|nr:hypothetical protein [Endozoicomonas acroporae]
MGNPDKGFAGRTVKSAITVLSAAVIIAASSTIAHAAEASDKDSDDGVPLYTVLADGESGGKLQQERRANINPQNLSVSRDFKFYNQVAALDLTDPVQAETFLKFMDIRLAEKKLNEEVVLVGNNESETKGQEVVVPVEQTVVTAEQQRALKPEVENETGVVRQMPVNTAITRDSKAREAKVVRPAKLDKGREQQGPRSGSVQKDNSKVSDAKSAVVKEKDQARLARVNEARQAREQARKKAEEQRLARETKEKAKAEELRLAEEQRRAKRKAKAEELRLAKEKRKAEEKAKAEALRAAEEKRKAEEKAKAEALRMAEEKRKAEEEKAKAEALRAAAEKRKVEEEKAKAEALRLAEEKRKVEEEKAKAEALRLAEEKRKVEEEKAKAEALRLAEEKRKTEEKAKAEALRVAEEKRKAEEKAKADELKVAEEKRKAEEKAREEKAKAEELKLAEEKLKAEEKNKAEKAKLPKEAAINILPSRPVAYQIAAEQDPGIINFDQAITRRFKVAGSYLDKGEHGNNIVKDHRGREFMNVMAFWDVLVEHRDNGENYYYGSIQFPLGSRHPAIIKSTVTGDEIALGCKAGEVLVLKGFETEGIDYSHGLVDAYLAHSVVLPDGTIAFQEVVRQPSFSLVNAETDCMPRDIFSRNHVDPERMGYDKTLDALPFRE